jgi:hypothetical protein
MEATQFVSARGRQFDGDLAAGRLGRPVFNAVGTLAAALDQPIQGDVVCLRNVVVGLNEGVILTFRVNLRTDQLLLDDDGLRGLCAGPANTLIDNDSNMLKVKEWKTYVKDCKEHARCGTYRMPCPERLCTASAC